MGYKVAPSEAVPHTPPYEADAVLHKKLPLKVRLAYSVGHVLNDLCASMWFSYFLIFFESVLRYDARLSGFLLLMGQVADAIATPIVGIESDKKRDFCVRHYGQRKSWHLAGTICVAITVPFIFNLCPGCSDASKWTLFAYYGFFIILSHFGWASTQVSHVALITDLTPVSKERVELNAYRHACTVASNICVYAVTWLVLGLSNDETRAEQLGPQDADVFRNIVLSVIAIGLVFSIIFHVFVPERKRSKFSDMQVKMAEILQVSGTNGTYRPKSYDDSLPTQVIVIPRPLGNELINSDKVHQNGCLPKPVTMNGDCTNKNTENGVDAIKVEKKDDEQGLQWRDWFRKIEFYQVGLIYTACRLFFNVSQVYTPLYLQDTLFLPKESIAYIPLTIYLSGFVFSFIIKPLNALTGTKVILFLGCIAGIAACVWIQFGAGESYKEWQIYVVAVLFGFTTTTLLVASLALSADLIGNNARSSAFVFGAMGFWDKLANGTAVILVQEFKPSKEGTGIAKEEYWYFRYVLVYVCGGALILITVVWITLLRSNIGSRKQNNDEKDQDPEKVQY